MFAVRSMKFLPAASVMAQTFRGNLLWIGQYRERQYAFANCPLLGEYERIAVSVTRTTAFYFLKVSTPSKGPFTDAGRGASATRRWMQTASCLRAFAPRSSRRNT